MAWDDVYMYVRDGLARCYAILELSIDYQARWSCVGLTWMEMVRASAWYAVSSFRPTSWTARNRSDTSSRDRSANRGTTRRGSTSTSAHQRLADFEIS
jgi:hypothetical protein